MSRILITLVGVSLFAVSAHSADKPQNPKEVTKRICCSELYTLVNRGGIKPATPAEKALYQDLQEWGEIVALREKIQQARRALTDPEYDPTELDVVSTLTATMFHAEGQAWDDVRTQSAKLRDLIEQSPLKRDEVAAQSAAVEKSLKVLQKPVYVRLQARPSAPAQDGDDSQETKEEEAFIKLVQQYLKEMFSDNKPITGAERDLIRALRRFDGKRYSARRAAFWLSGYRQGAE